jgi:hypothetical protein
MRTLMIVSLLELGRLCTLGCMSTSVLIVLRSASSGRTSCNARSHGCQLVEVCIKGCVGTPLICVIMLLQ